MAPGEEDRAFEAALALEDKLGAAIMVSVSDDAELAQLPPRRMQSVDLDRPYRSAREDFEKRYFEFHLARHGGIMARVAEKTGVERTHLYRRLRQLRIQALQTRVG